MDYDDLVNLGGPGGDAARSSLANPAMPGETPQATIARQYTAQASQDRQNRLQSEDYSNRQIPSYTDESGAVQPVRDETGGVMTSFDPKNRVAYDTSGMPKKLSYGETGPPQLLDPYAGVQPTTDPTTGDKYIAPAGLAPRWIGQDPTIAAQALQDQNDKALQKAAAAEGTMQTLEAAQMKGAETALTQQQKSLQTRVPGLAALPPDADRDDALKTINDHFDAGAQDPQANEKTGILGFGDLTPAAQQYRQQLDQGRDAALQQANDLYDKKDALQQQKDTLDGQRNQRLAMLAARANDLSGQVNGKIYGVDDQGQVVLNPQRPADSIAQAEADKVSTFTDAQKDAATQVQTQLTALAAAKAGQKPYTILPGDDGKDRIAIDPAKPFDSMQAAVNDGLLPKPPPEISREAKIMQAAIEKSGTAGSYAEAVVRGAVPGAVGGYLGMKVLGGVIGAGLGALVPGGGETGLTEYAGYALGAKVVGNIIGAFVGGKIAASAADQALKAAGKVNDWVASVNDAGQLHSTTTEISDFLGNVVGAGGIGSVKNLADLATIGKGFNTLSGSAAKAVMSRVALSTGAGVGFEAVLREPLDRGLAAIQSSLGYQPDEVIPPTAKSLVVSGLLAGIFGGHQMEFKDLSQPEIMQGMMKGKIRTAEGLKLDEPIDPAKIGDILQRNGLPNTSDNVRAFGAPMTSGEAGLYRTLAPKIDQMQKAGLVPDVGNVKQATQGGAHVFTAGDVNDLNAPKGQTTGTSEVAPNGGGPSQPGKAPDLNEPTVIPWGDGKQIHVTNEGGETKWQAVQDGKVVGEGAAPTKGDAMDIEAAKTAAAKVFSGDASPTPVETPSPTGTPRTETALETKGKPTETTTDNPAETLLNRPLGSRHVEVGDTLRDTDGTAAKVVYAGENNFHIQREGETAPTVVPRATIEQHIVNNQLALEKGSANATPTGNEPISSQQQRSGTPPGAAVPANEGSPREGNGQPASGGNRVEPAASKGNGETKAGEPKPKPARSTGDESAKGTEGSKPADAKHVSGEKLTGENVLRFSKNQAIKVVFPDSAHDQDYHAGFNKDARPEQREYNSQVRQAAKLASDRGETEFKAPKMSLEDFTAEDARKAIRQAVANNKVKVPVHETEEEIPSGIKAVNGEIHLNPERFANTMTDVRKAQRAYGEVPLGTPQDYAVHGAGHEEISHVFQHHLAIEEGYDGTTDKYSRMADSGILPKDWYSQVKKAYVSFKDKPYDQLSKEDKAAAAAEFERMALQAKVKGTITEAFWNHLRDLVDYLKQIAKTGSQAFKDHVQRLEDTMNGLKVAKREMLPEVSEEDRAKPEEGQKEERPPPVSRATPDSAKILHEEDDVRVNAPNGSKFLRATDAEGKQTVEPINAALKGRNPFKGEGPFEHVEAGWKNKSGDFVPLEGDLSIAKAPELKGDKTALEPGKSAAPPGDQAPAAPPGREPARAKGGKGEISSGKDARAEAIAKLKNLGDSLEAEAPQPRSVEEIGKTIDEQRQRIEELDRKLKEHAAKVAKELPPKEELLKDRESIAARIKKLGENIARARKGLPLEAEAPTAQIPFPHDKLPVLFDALESVRAAGVKSPEDFARLLQESIGPKSQKYAQAIWNIASGAGHVDPGTHDWPSLYGDYASIPDKKEDTGKQKSVEALHSNRRVTVETPKGATFLRTTDARDRFAVEPLSNVNKGANPFHQAGPFKQVEAGKRGRKGEFIPMAGDVKVSQALPKSHPLEAESVPAGQSNLTAPIEKNIRDAEMMDAKDPAGFLRRYAKAARAQGKEEAADNFEAAAAEVDRRKAGNFGVTTDRKHAAEVLGRKGDPYDAAQKKIDAIEDRLESRGVNVIKLVDTKSNPGAKILLGDGGYTEMPEDLAAAYRDRDEIGAKQFSESRRQISTSLLSNGLTQAEADRVLKYYGIDPKNTDAATQSIAYEHAVKIAKTDPRKQAESIAYELAAQRDEMFDELRDVSKNSLVDAAKAVKYVRGYFGIVGSSQALEAESVRQMVQPGLDAIGGSAEEITRGIRALFAPTTLAASDAVDALHRFKGEQDERLFKIGRVLKDAKKMFTRMGQQASVDFIDRFKTGKPQPTPELQKIAATISAFDTETWKAAQQAYRDAGYKDGEIPLAWKENHFRVLWKVIPGTEEERRNAGLHGKGPLSGSKGMQKHATLPDISTGLAMGGIPYSYNPVDLFERAQSDLGKLTGALNMVTWMKKNGFVAFKSGAFPKLDPGCKWVDDPLFRVYFPAESGEGLVAAGRWEIEENMARLLKNYLSRDFVRESALGKTMMFAKNLITEAELALSPFHALAMTLEASGSTAGRGFYTVFNRGFLHADPGAAWEGIKAIVEGLIPGASVTSATKQGSRALRLVTEPGYRASPDGKALLKQFPNLDHLVHLAFVGGMKLDSQDWKTQSARVFLDAVSGIAHGDHGATNYIKSVLMAVPALNETLMSPLFDHLIPNLKMGIFIREMNDAMKQNRGVLTDDALARKTWRFVEDRFGEVNFDNLWWNRTFKAGMQLFFRSVSWKLGSIYALGGAIAGGGGDGGEGGSVGGQAGELLDAIKNRRAPVLHRKFAWLLGMCVTTAAMAYVIQKLLTGKDPSSLADLTDPQIDPQDQHVRASLPTYVKDLVHVGHDPLKYLTSSLSGWLNKLAELWQNKDFYGTEIRHPGDALPTQAKDIGKYLASGLMPFSIRGYKNLSDQQVAGARKYLSMLGMSPAPKYVSQTTAEKLADHFREQHEEVGARTQAQAQRSHDRFQAVQAMQRGLPATMQGFTPTEVRQIAKRAGMTPFAYEVSRLGTEEVEAVFQVATPKERAELAPIVASRIRRNPALAGTMKSF